MDSTRSCHIGICRALLFIETANRGCLLESISRLHHKGRASLVIHDQLFPPCRKLSKRGQGLFFKSCIWLGPEGWVVGLRTCVPLVRRCRRDHWRLPAHLVDKGRVVLPTHRTSGNREGL
jgi:hypothetical protein